MASSSVQVCNIALGSLGANLITSLSEASVEATLCNVHWDNARRSTLRNHPWNFSIKRTQLTELETAPLFEYDKQFQMPSDLLRLLRVYEDFNYKVEGHQIITNKTDCLIKYVYDNTDVASWPDSFVDLVAARLKVDLSYGITKSSSQKQLCVEEYKEKLTEARAQDSQEDISDPFGLQDSNLIAVRN